MFIFGKRKPVVFALGGAGGNFLSGYKNNEVRIVALNSDLHDLKKCQIKEKILVGRKACKSLGCGGNIELGKSAAQEDFKKITKLVRKTSKIILLAGVGGGFGSGAAYVISKLAYDLQIDCSLICTTPFSFEGKNYKKAQNILSEISVYNKSVFVFPNDELENGNEYLTVGKILSMGNQRIIKQLEECLK